MAQGKQTVDDNEILEYISSIDEPIVTASEIGEEFGATRQWAHKRLQAIVDDGKLERKQSGGHLVVWYLTDR